MIHKRVLWAAAFVASWLAAAHPGHGEEAAGGAPLSGIAVYGIAVYGIARVVDGDTLVVGGRRLTLWGIDAPELGQKCLKPDGETFRMGAFAASFLQELLQTQPLNCDLKAGEDGAEPAALCRFPGGEPLNAALVSGGLAYADPERGELYAALEADARAGRRGLWAMDCVPPWEWRRGTRVKAGE